MSRAIISLFAIVVVLGTFYLAGCSRSDAPPRDASVPPARTAATDDSADEHGHKPGAHGGIIVSIGLDSYHAEAVFEAGGVLRLFMLGRDETRVIDVESQTLTAYVKASGEQRAIPIALQPEPQPGDADGKTSLFVGVLPEALADKSVEVTVPNISIGGERFRVAFASASGGHSDEAMPDKVVDEEERQLYLTPGGLYTAADIEANGNVTASQKFRNFKASHDLKPKAGEKICPVTLTKATPDCSWIVGGKTYEFCCPPCVDEFVSLAKTNPEDVKEPEEYVKK